MEKGQYSNTIGAIKLLNKMLRLGADQKSMRAPVGYGQGATAQEGSAENLYVMSISIDEMV